MIRLAIRKGHIYYGYFINNIVMFITHRKGEYDYHYIGDLDHDLSTKNNIKLKDAIKLSIFELVLKRKKEK
jgi:hypothetical protein